MSVDLKTPYLKEKMTSPSMLGRRQSLHCPNAHAVEQAKRSLNGRNPEPARGSQVSWKNATTQTGQALHTLKETQESQVSPSPSTSDSKGNGKNIWDPLGLECPPETLDFSIEFASEFS
jgi:hypothetical protein